MEKQKPFTLFVPPRLSSQVSAVKPQTLGGESSYFKTFNKCTEDDTGFPFAISNFSKNGDNIDSDPALQKQNFLPMIEQVANSGSCHYQEGLKDSDFEFENEKVSLKLEEEIQENKDLIKENNATRHLCNLLKETCARSAEKTKKYEYEREETRQVYVDLNNSIEKMIIAFEELRVQAENSRLEIH
uniref:Synaptonemal complex protein 1 n=1 Tax=Jaculus jaculus TaxID=51337 RepID=A0A8C5KYV2_JACJA